MNKIKLVALKLALACLGMYGLFISLDFGLGGFVTLGWQGSPDFLEVLDQTRYGVQDSHFRFLSGLLGGISLFMIFSVRNLPKYQEALKLVLALIFLGGIFRLSSGDFDLIFGPEISVALLAETGLTLVLYIWLTQALKGSRVA